MAQQHTPCAHILPCFFFLKIGDTEKNIKTGWNFFLLVSWCTSEMEICAVLRPPPPFLFFPPVFWKWRGCHLSVGYSSCPHSRASRGRVWNQGVYREFCETRNLHLRLTGLHWIFHFALEKSPLLRRAHAPHGQMLLWSASVVNTCFSSWFFIKEKPGKHTGGQKEPAWSKLHGTNIRWE